MNIITSNGRLYSELFGTGYGSGRVACKELGLNIQEAAIIQHVIGADCISTHHVARAFKITAAKARRTLIKGDRLGLIRRAENSQRNNIIWTKALKEQE